MLAQEEGYTKLRRQFDDVEADLKQAMAHNEQVLPISSEMRSLINTLQLQNKQLKNEVYRFRRKSKEAAQNHQQIADELKATQEELAQVRKAFSEANAAVLKLTEEMSQAAAEATSTIPETAGTSEVGEQHGSAIKSEAPESADVKPEITSPTSSSGPHGSTVVSYFLHCFGLPPWTWLGGGASQTCGDVFWLSVCFRVYVCYARPVVFNHCCVLYVCATRPGVR